MSDLDRYYRILGLEPGASPERLKQAYRDLVWVWHPDRFEGNPRLQKVAQEKLKEINKAYEQLKSVYTNSHSHKSQQQNNQAKSSQDQKKTHEQSASKSSPKEDITSKSKSVLGRVAILFFLFVLVSFLSRQFFRPAINPTKLGQELTDRSFTTTTPRSESDVASDRAMINAPASEGLCVYEGDIFDKLSPNPNPVLNFAPCTEELLKKGYRRVPKNEKPTAETQQPLSAKSRIDVEQQKQSLDRPATKSETQMATKPDAAITRLRADVIRKMKESRASAAKVLALHEEEKNKLSAQYEQKRELYNQGRIGRAELNEVERALANAIVRVEEDKRWIAESDITIKEAIPK
jgi:curved DNA-binding protein CbpA